MTKKERKIWALAVVAAIAVLMGAYFGVISPQLKAQSSAKTTATKTQDAAEATAAEADGLAIKTANIDDAIAEMTRNFDQFPSDYEQGELFDLVYAAATDSQVTIDALTPSTPGQLGQVAGTAPVAGPLEVAPLPGALVDPAAVAAAAAAVPAAGTVDPLTNEPVAAPPLAESAVTMNVTGPRPNLVTFIRKLETLERPILLTNVTFTDGGEGATLAITGRTFLIEPLDVPAEFARAND